MKKDTPIYTIDSETDPFAYGRRPDVFLWGLYVGASGEFSSYWGKDCTAKLMRKLSELPPGIVYFHNGGKFDVFFMLDYIDKDQDILMIHGRVTQCYIKAKSGFHKLRDSLKILPFSLSTYKKDEMDYNLMEADVRESHKETIISYLKGDCVYLYDLCIDYINHFGPALTIGSSAMKELQARHDTGDPLTPTEDKKIRDKYYVGGRVERFKTGILEGSWKVYDVNSMYPYVMSNFNHPIGHPDGYGNEVDKDTYFVTATGYSHGAFPIRTKTGISFPHAFGTYSISIHEWKTALDLGLFECDTIEETVQFYQSCCFDKYIMEFYHLRQNAKDGLIDHLKDCTHCKPNNKVFCKDANVFRRKDIFYKFLLNNSYGRFAINPEGFKEYRITEETADMRWHGYKISEVLEDFRLILWERPAKEFKYSNVATGASVTGGARSILLRGLHGAVNPVYCDTDCVICEDISGVELHATKLGAWDLEKTGNVLAIAGRKMYALYNQSACVKYACKGVKITPEDVKQAASGQTITYYQDAPTFKLDGTVQWIKRNVRMV